MSLADLGVQCNPYQNPSQGFCTKEKVEPKIHMEVVRTQSSHNFEKENGGTLPFRFQMCRELKLLQPSRRGHPENGQPPGEGPSTAPEPGRPSEGPGDPGADAARALRKRDGLRGARCSLAWPRLRVQPEHRGEKEPSRREHRRKSHPCLSQVFQLQRDPLKRLHNSQTMEPP